MFKKTFIALGLLLICCCQQAIAQTEIDCQLLKKKIDYATANSTSFSINYVSNSRKIYIHYEEDSIDNKHFIYTNYGEENSERALIWIKNKVYWTKRKASNDSSAVDWSDQLSIYFNYDEWIDSCKSAKSIFNQPLICTFKDNILVSGTPFDIFGIKIEKDTFKVWLNKKTDKIEKIQGENKQRDIHFDWLFDVPFTIKSPTNISNEEKNFGDLDRTGGDTAKAEDSGNQGDHQKNDGIVQHLNLLGLGLAVLLLKRLQQG